MIAWILGIALVVAIGFALFYREEAKVSEDFRQETAAFNSRILMIIGDLQEELKRTGTHRDELMARYGDQEAERIASTEKAAKRF